MFLGAPVAHEERGFYSFSDRGQILVAKHRQSKNLAVIVTHTKVQYIINNLETV